jgi:hypothetical protein
MLASYQFYSEWLSVVKRCESVNTMASFLWWIVGFYWVVSGGDILLRDAPRLYWYASTTLECPLFISYLTTLFLLNKKKNHTILFLYTVLHTYIHIYMCVCVYIYIYIYFFISNIFY